MIKVVGCDLDNTLYDQELFELEVFEKIANQIEIDYGISKKEYLKSLRELYVKGKKKNVFDEALKSLNIFPQNNWENYVKSTLLPIYRNFIPSKLELYQNSLDYLDFFYKNNYKLALITNGRKYTQNLKIDLLNIRKYFDEILISDEYGISKRKPSTFMFLQILLKFDIKSHEMIYIGDDNINDKSSEKIGIKFINIQDLDLNFFQKNLIDHNMIENINLK